MVVQRTKEGARASPRVTLSLHETDRRTGHLAIEAVAALTRTYPAVGTCQKAAETRRYSNQNPSGPILGG